MSNSCTLSIDPTETGYLLSIAGRGTMRESPAVRDFICGAIEDGAAIVLDLTHCDYLDSTFLGCLVLLQKRSKSGSFQIVADHDLRRKLFASVPFDNLLDFRTSCPPSRGEPVVLPVADLDRVEFCQHLMETHQKLADLGGPAADAFLRIAQQLKRELEELA